MGLGLGLRLGLGLGLAAALRARHRAIAGIAAHRDGPLYAPRVAIVSLGAACTFDFVSDDAARKLRAPNLTLT